MQKQHTVTIPILFSACFPIMDKIHILSQVIFSEKHYNEPEKKDKICFLTKFWGLVTFGKGRDSHYSHAPILYAAMLTAAGVL